MFSIYKVTILKKNKYKCVAIIMTLVLLLSACVSKSNINIDSSQFTEDKESKIAVTYISEENNDTKPNQDIDDSGKIKGGKTLEESMDYYIQKIESSKGLTGDFFTGKYKIIDTEETSDRLNVYAHVVSRMGRHKW